MSAIRVVLIASVLLACGESQPQADASPPLYTPPDAEPPVAVNAESPIHYPPAMWDRKIEGEVVLRLFVDSTGRLHTESTRVAEPSGHAALDSAAVAGAALLRYAPARRRGIPVATTFLQPIDFRHPEGAVIRGAPPGPPAPLPARPAPSGAPGPAPVAPPPPPPPTP
jgi:protein TonB